MSLPVARQHSIEDCGDYLRVNVSGVVDLKRIVQIIDEIAVIPDSSSMYDLWDFRDCQLELDAAESFHLVDLLRKRQSQWCHAKTAVLAKPGFDRIVAELMTVTTSFEFAFEAFAYEGEALAWLAGA